MRKVILTWILSFFWLQMVAQVEGLHYYLPENYTYNPAVPTPSSVLGFEVGEWHASHDQVVLYFKSLAEASNRLSLIEYGKTYENRPLLMLVASSPDNIENLDKIKAQRNNFRDPTSPFNIEEMPVIMYMGHSVHGNESSGVNASLLSAYHFAAANELEEDLENMVLLIDPALNPDGINRFASWVNMHRSYHMNGDRNNRELNEAWPRGRTNHYWFDLNRDWLSVQHPESRGRIRELQQWKPNMVLDIHEMSTDNTYFFQPGIPSRNHPLTPEKNFELTEKIAQYHARYLDEIGSLYYSQESFDDFYYGKGSTYPDVQGAVGILFEQASSRGHLQETKSGTISFPFTIRNQFTTTLSSFEAAKDMRLELNQYMQDFYNEARAEAGADNNEAYIFGSTDDYGRVFHLAEMILHHDIQLFSLEENVNLNGVEFEAKKAYIVPLKQPQYRLIKSMFETRTEFEDSLFYDVSSWTLPLAFNLDFMALSSRILNLAKVEEVKAGLDMEEGEVIGPAGANSYAFEWKEYYAPKALYQLMEKGYQLRVSHEPFQNESGNDFGRGSILIEKGNTQVDDENFYADLRKAAAESGITIHAMSTGYTSGVNLGSPKINILEKPSIALVVDGGVNSNEAGEIWHLFDQRMEMPITLLPMDRFNMAPLERYNVIILVNGSYSGMGKSGTEKLKDWIQKGGTLIARGSAMNWLTEQELASFTFKKSSPIPIDTLTQRNYADRERARGARLTGGAIFNVQLDITHPLGYGYSKPEMYIFRSGNQFLNTGPNPYINPLIYTAEPLASGYIHPTNLEQLRNTGSIQVSMLGSGRIIGFVDNANFRAFWFGTNKLFLNAVFFGQTLN